MFSKNPLAQQQYTLVKDKIFASFLNIVMSEKTAKKCILCILVKIRRSEIELEINLPVIT